MNRSLSPKRRYALYISSSKKQTVVRCMHLVWFGLFFHFQFIDHFWFACLKKNVTFSINMRMRVCSTFKKLSTRRKYFLSATKKAKEKNNNITYIPTKLLMDKLVSSFSAAIYSKDVSFPSIFMYIR